jgi:hypothetical protein
LLFIKLLSLLLKTQANSGHVISNHIDDISAILVALLGDSFPDVKKEAATAVEELANVASSHIHTTLGRLPFIYIYVYVNINV